MWPSKERSYDELREHLAELRLRQDWSLNWEDIRQCQGGQGTVLMILPHHAVCKFYPDHPQHYADIERGLRVQSAAYEAGLPVPRILVPLRTWKHADHGSYYIEERMSGETMGAAMYSSAARPAEKAVLRMGRAIGRFVAAFDAALGGRAGEFGLDDGSHRDFFGIDNGAHPDFAAARTTMAKITDEALRTVLSRHLETAIAGYPDASRIEKRLIHGDLHGGNLMILPDGGVGAIDFGVTKKDSIEYALRLLAFFRPPLLEAAIDGYKQASGKDVQPSIIAYHVIGHFAHSYDKLGDRRDHVAMRLVENLEVMARLSAGKPKAGPQNPGLGINPV